MTVRIDETIVVGWLFCPTLVRVDKMVEVMKLGRELPPPLAVEETELPLPEGPFDDD